MSQADPTRRFSDRVADYVRYRPGYPREAVDAVVMLCNLQPGDVVADIGAGTGILTALLLERGLRVAAVEPNEAMRAAMEQQLAGRAGFTSHDGTAEATTLAAHSVKAVAAAQAFHWFEMDRARREFQRILEPGRGVALLWNDRRVDTTPFLRDYERLLQTYGTDYRQVDHKRIDEAQLAAFFSPGRCETRRFENEQVFGFAALKGRLLSSSYAPPAGHPAHKPMLAEL
ncbi:MAG: class I SAM-dependent methyltransferase, partial [Phycisphaeraceae bacterium]